MVVLRCGRVARSKWIIQDLHPLDIQTQDLHPLDIQTHHESALPYLLLFSNQHYDEFNQDYYKCVECYGAVPATLRIYKALEQQELEE